MRALSFLFVLAATAAGAQMTDEQQSVIDALHPELTQVLGNEGSATTLATCIVETASARETRRMAAADDQAAAFAIANDVMTRPELLTCVTEKLSQ